MPSKLPAARTAYAPMTKSPWAKKPGALTLGAAASDLLELAAPPLPLPPLTAAVPLPVAVGTVPSPFLPAALSNEAQPLAVDAL